MKIACDTKTLNRAIQTVLKAVNGKPNTPILSGILIKAGKDTLELQGTDNNLAISCKITADIQQEGQILVAARNLSELVRKIPEVSITIEEDDTLVKIITEKSEYKLLKMPAADFPEFFRTNKEATFSVNTETLKEIIRNTAFACSTDTKRPMFTGILADIKADRINFVATNTHRLALKALLQENTSMDAMIIPGRVMTELDKMIGYDKEKNATFIRNGSRLTINYEDTTIVTNLIEGKFPDYSRIMPTQYNTVVKTDTKKLAGAIDRMLIFNDLKTSNVVKFDIQPEKLVLSSASPEKGNGTETLDCEFAGTPIKVAFNGKYILDYLENTAKETVTLSLNNNLSPARLSKEENNNDTYIVTPVRTI